VTCCCGCPANMSCFLGSRASGPSSRLLIHAHLLSSSNSYEKLATHDHLQHLQCIHAGNTNEQTADAAAAVHQRSVAPDDSHHAN
jgi:hypothetical protein